MISETMDTVDWDEDILGLNLGCQNIFDEISLDFLDDLSLSNTEYYEPKSKPVIPAAK